MISAKQNKFLAHLFVWFLCHRFWSQYLWHNESTTKNIVFLKFFHSLIVFVLLFCILFSSSFLFKSLNQTNEKNLIYIQGHVQTTKLSNLFSFPQKRCFLFCFVDGFTKHYAKVHFIKVKVILKEEENMFRNWDACQVNRSSVCGSKMKLNINFIELYWRKFVCNNFFIQLIFLVLTKVSVINFFLHLNWNIIG